MKKNLFAILVALVCLVAFSGCGIQAIPRQENDVEASWAEVLNQYQRRADLIPNLVETVKGYAKHESGTLEAVVKARAEASQIKLSADQLTDENLARFQKAQDQLKGSLSRLMVVAEQYPALKADGGFRDLQAQLEGTENRITIARRRFIDSVREFNNLVTVFPTSITNSLFLHKTKKPQFTVANEAQLATPPKVGF